MRIRYGSFEVCYRDPAFVKKVQELAADLDNHLTVKAHDETKNMLALEFLPHEHEAWVRRLSELGGVVAFIHPHDAGRLGYPPPA